MSMPLSALLLLAPGIASATPPLVASLRGPDKPSSTPPGACEGVLGLAPKDAPPLRAGEQLEYELTLEGAYMGKLELSVGQPRRVGGAEAVPLFGRLRTNAFISAVKAVEGRYQAIVDPTTLAPVGVRVEAKVGDDQRWEKVQFTDGGRQVSTQYRFRGRERRKAFRAEHPLLEGLSLLHFARRVALEPGLSACQEILSTRRMWRVQAHVLGKETVETPAGPKPAYRVRTVFTRRADPTGKRRIEIDILLGDIPGRPPLAFEMQQSKYSGRARLVRWRPGRPT